MTQLQYTYTRPTSPLPPLFPPIQPYPLHPSPIPLYARTHTHFLHMSRASEEDGGWGRGLWVRGEDS